MYLIKIAGPDQPRISATFTEFLAGYGATVLDIGQSVIHDQVSLGMLLELPSEVDRAGFIEQAEQTCRRFQLSFQAHEVQADTYEEWVRGQGKDRHIITLLARKITARQLAAITAIVAQQGLTIDDINRLSGRISLRNQSVSQRACVELTVRGIPNNSTQMRSDFLALTSELGVDVAFQQDNVFRRNRRLVCFDMDSTLIEAEVIDELAKAAGVGEQVAAITERAMAGELDFTQSFKQRVALLKGLDEAVLADIASSLPITEGAEKLIRTLKVLGYKTAILSGGFTYFGHYLQQRLGIDYVFANELAIADGKVTGAVEGPVVDGQRKAELLRQIAEQEGLDLQQVIAVGDGANDLPMLNLAGLGIAFRAKPLVKQSAEHAITELGLDGILYLLGVKDMDSAEILQRYPDLRS